MHRVAVVADHQSSQAPRSSTSHPPIGSYPRVPVQVHQADPYAPEAARRLIALIATRYPSAPAEHVGSSAVPRLAGKNIIDLLMAATPADVAATTAALLAGAVLASHGRGTGSKPVQQRHDLPVPR